MEKMAQISILTSTSQNTQNQACVLFFVSDQSYSNSKINTKMSFDLHKQVEQAFEVLQKLTKKEDDELIAEDPNVTLIFKLWENYNSKNQYPETITLRHELYADSTLRVVIITKDPHDEWKEKIRDIDFDFPVKTYSVKKFGDRFRLTHDARQLLKDSRCILADSRIAHVLNDRLGKEFYDKKRIPILVNLQGEDIKTPIENALKCAPYILPKDTKFAAPIGKMSWSKEDIADNACDVINGVFEKIGKDKVATVHIRTPESMTIPVYAADITSIIEQKE